MKSWEIVLVNVFGIQTLLHHQALTFAEAAKFAYLERNKILEETRILSVMEVKG